MSLPPAPSSNKLPSLKKSPVTVEKTSQKTLPELSQKTSPSKTLPVSPQKTLPVSPQKTLPVSPQKTLPVSPKKVSPKVSPKKVSNKKEDLRDHLDTFFGKRNNIEGKPVEGKNYTQETLTYMTSRNRADDITKTISNKIDGSFEVIECCGGIGGNSLSFLDNPKVTRLTVFEIDSDRRKMLKNNLEMYKLDKKATVEDEPFSTIECGENKQVLFFDPPWLPSGVKGQEANKKDYILSGIKIGDKTLEELVSCSLTAFKLPIGYKFGNVPGYSKEEISFKNSLLIILKRKEEYETWRNNLRSFLRNVILSKIISSDAVLNKLVSDDAMKIWEVAFTNESFNPNVTQNYEELELLGDVALAHNYVKFMMASYPEITRSQLSEFRTKYLAKGFQSKLSGSLGFGQHIRSRFRTNTHILEDVLESFFGALELIGDKEFKFGAGSGLVYNMVVELYKDVPVDWDVTLGNSKTRVKETYEGLQWINPKINKEKVPEQVIENEDGTTTFSILIPQNGINFLKNIGVNVTSNVLATVTENTKKIASNNAYVIAVRKLQQLGITDEFLINYKKSKDLNNQELIPYINSIKPRLLNEGYIDFYLTEHHVKSKAGMAQKTSKYIQLIGVDSNGKKEILGMTPDPVADVLEGKKDVLQKYANNK